MSVSCEHKHTSTYLTHSLSTTQSLNLNTPLYDRKQYLVSSFFTGPDRALPQHATVKQTAAGHLSCYVVAGYFLAALSLSQAKGSCAKHSHLTNNIITTIIIVRMIYNNNDDDVHACQLMISLGAWLPDWLYI